MERINIFLIYFYFVNILLIRSIPRSVCKARFIHLQSSYRRTVGSLFPSLRSSLIRSHSRRRPGREPEGRPEGAGLTSRPGLRREGVESG